MKVFFIFGVFSLFLTCSLSLSLSLSLYRDPLCLPICGGMSILYPVADPHMDQKHIQTLPSPTSTHTHIHPYAYTFLPHIIVLTAVCLKGEVYRKSSRLEVCPLIGNVFLFNDPIPDFFGHFAGVTRL